MTDVDAKTLAIIEYVRANPDATTEEIAAALHDEPSTIARIINTLLSGLVRGRDGEPWTSLDTLKPASE
jgi:predicted transcriptional regulator